MIVSEGSWLLCVACFLVLPMHTERAFDTQSKSTPGIAVEQKIPDSQTITCICVASTLPHKHFDLFFQSLLYFFFFWVLHIILNINSVIRTSHANWANSVWICDLRMLTDNNIAHSKWWLLFLGRTSLS